MHGSFIIKFVITVYFRHVYDKKLSLPKMAWNSDKEVGIPLEMLSMHDMT